MFFLLWDASALAQRYAPEIGQQTVQALFTAVAKAQMITTVLSYSETCGALVRKRKVGALYGASFSVARSALRAEVIDDAEFGVLAVELADILGGIDLIDRHNLLAVPLELEESYERSCSILNIPRARGQGIGDQLALEGDWELACLRPSGSENAPAP